MLPIFSICPARLAAAAAAPSIIPFRSFSSAAGFLSVDGVEQPDPSRCSVSVFDESFQRGDGVFEVVRVQPGGAPRALHLHLDRLERSASAIGVPLPPRETVGEWVRRAADAGGPGGSVRLIATKGAASPDEGSGPRVFVMWQPLPAWPDTFRLMPMLAPWHPAGRDGWDAVKWLSYSPNLLSTRRAKKSGFTDAMLLARPATPPVAEENDENGVSSKDVPGLGPLLDMNVLDGPNFCIGWLRRGVLEFPHWETLGLLQSTSQMLATQAARDVLRLPLSEAVFTLRDALEANEMFVMSSTRGVIRVESVGGHAMPDTSFTNELSDAIEKICETEP